MWYLSRAASHVFSEASRMEKRTEDTDGLHECRLGIRIVPNVWRKWDFNQEQEN